MAENVGASKTKLRRLIGGCALILIAIMGGIYNLTKTPISTGDLLNDTLNQSGDNKTIDTIFAVGVLGWGVHLVRTSKQ